ncbi:MAG: TerC family protein [Gammaproteobacteria bacterium]|nr:TerC family protein [Gammaproteobacteria bacterium]MYK84519.1 TerC family protein [Gammaproteobacteria bacterium]
MEWLADPSLWAAFLTLTALEIVLGIDNIIFISILTARLPPDQQRRGRYLGLMLAMLMRIGLLFSLTWIMSLTADLFTVFGNAISMRDLILLGGGAFLMAKATREVHNSLEGTAHGHGIGVTMGFAAVMAQIAVVDIVFSLDSVITAVGLVEHIEIMVAAIVIAVAVMMVASGAISDFVERHPTVKMLALSFLILIGLTLVGEGLDFHTPKGYIYFAMAFAFGVEMLNLRARKARGDQVVLRKAQLGDLIQPG